MHTRLPTTRSNNRQRGATALEVAIFTIAGLVVATIAAVTLLNVSFGVAESGAAMAGNGVARSNSSLELRPGVIAVRGDVDVDGDNSIDLGGVDQQAIVKVEFTVAAPAGGPVDLTPPYSVDDSGVDPDAESTSPSTLIRVSTGAWQVSEAAWTVAISGGNSDFILEGLERATITVWLHQYDGDNDLYQLGAGQLDPWIDDPAQILQGTDRFAIDVVTREGTGLELERTLPIELTPQLLLD